MRKICLLALIIIFFFCGCAGESQSEVFALPQMPETHSALLDTVEQVRSEGFEFAEPRSGVNRRPLNLVDIDGDGEEEGIAFLRDVLNSGKTYIYIFEQSDSVFSLFDVIEGNENEIYTVSYSRLLDDKGYELIVKWGADEKSGHALTAYNLTPNGAKKVFDTVAEQYSVSDLDSDGDNELLAVVNKNGHVFADIYTEENGSITRKESVHLSEYKGRVIRIISGKATADLNAAFIERESNGLIITDVITYKEGRYLNLLPQGNISEIRALSADVNGDAIIEIPRRTSTLQDNSETDRTYLWREIDESGIMHPKTFTYHSFSKNWYLSMPMLWEDTVTMRETRIGNEWIRIDFVTREKIVSDEENFIEAPLFSIHIFTGSNRKTLATQNGRFIIAEREDMIFAGEILSEEYLSKTINADFLKSSFKTRESDWVSEILFA